MLCATFLFRVGLCLLSCPPRHDCSLREGFDFGFYYLSACVLLQLAFLGLAPPATLTVRGRVLAVVCLAIAPLSSRPPRHAGGTRQVYDWWFALLECLRFLPLHFFAFFWLHSQAVQRFGSGSSGAASSIDGLVRENWIFRNFPHFCICGSSGRASVMVRPWKAGNFLRNT